MGTEVSQHGQGKRMYRNPMALIGCAFVCTAGLGEAHAATFTPVDNNYCKIALNGSIEAGDFERLQSVIERVRKVEGSRFSVCLNSLGGNYDEGLKMARLLLERGVGTVVLPQRQCYSACAIMFMFGSFWGTDYARWPNRRLAAEAALGFHAPYQQGGDVQEPNAAYSANFQQGVRAIGRFLTALYQTKSASGGYIDRDSLNAFFPPELVAAMISKGPDEAFIIRTLDDAGRWGIDFIASNPSPALNLQNVFQACNNARSWRTHEHATVVTAGELRTAHGEEPGIKREGNTTRVLLPGYIGLTDEACVVEQILLDDGQTQYGCPARRQGRHGNEVRERCSVEPRGNRLDGWIR